MKYLLDVYIKIFYKDSCDGGGIGIRWIILDICGYYYEYY